MLNPLINQKQNTNNKNQENQTIEVQYQPNQPSLEPLGTSLQSYNLSNTPYSNTIIPQGQFNPYQKAPYMQFNIIIHGIPFTDFSGQLNFQPKSEYNINYEEIKHISQIPHLKFTQPEENIFLISQRKLIFIPIFIIFLATPNLLIPIIIGIPELFSLYIFSFIFIAIAILFCIKIDLQVYFILGQNNITVKKNNLFRKKTYIYNSDELLRVEYQQNMRDTGKGPRFFYEIVFVKTKGDPEKIYEANSSSFNFHEIGFFIHIINKHIQNNMTPK